jgi:hypothetical protein
MGRQHVTDGEITVTQVKPGTRLSLPMLSALIAAIDFMPADNMTYLVTAYRKPFTENGFVNWFRAQYDAAELPHCSAHGLHKAPMRQMAEAGFTQQEIKAWSTHKRGAEVALYVRDADQARLAEGAQPELAKRRIGSPRQRVRQFKHQSGFRPT